jgi:hypothetical protein
MMNAQERRDAQVITLFDALVASPDGLTIFDIGDLFGIDANYDRTKINKIIRRLRLKLGEANADPDDRIHGYAVPVQWRGDKCFYVLTANREQSEKWRRVRLDTSISRIQIDLAHWQALAAITDGRTAEGKIARVYTRHFSRLLEDLTSIKEGTF